MKKSGLADSPFFNSPSKPPLPSSSSVFSASTVQESPVAIERHDTAVSRYHDPIVELVRKAVKEFGKEAATHRFTLAEKRAIANIVHTLQMQGVRTTENEITRIAINFIISEFNQKGSESLLGRVLQALKM